MYVGHDSANSRVILRYFARDPDPVIFAGWQVQLVYALPRMRLVRAYVEQVPLE
jgi:ferredoxin-NADP reductase